MTCSSPRLWPAVSSGMPKWSATRRYAPSTSDGLPLAGNQMAVPRRSAGRSRGASASGWSTLQATARRSSTTGWCASPPGQGRSRSWTRPKQASSSPRPSAARAAPRLRRMLSSMASPGVSLSRRRTIRSGACTWPQTSRRSGQAAGRAALAAASAAASSALACGRKRWPASVSSTPRVARTNSGSPRACSSRWMRLDSACWVSNIRALARPRTKKAMAAALPLERLAAWRVYLGLPMVGTREPAGGPEELARLGVDDFVGTLLGPMVEQAVAEFPAAVAGLRTRLPVDEGPIGLLGGQVGAAVALLALAEAEVPVRAAALVRPAVQLNRVVAANDQGHNPNSRWTRAARVVAERLDFVARAHQLAGRSPANR